MFFSKNVKPAYIIDKNASQIERKFGIPVVRHEFILQSLDLNKCKFVVTSPRYRDEIINDIKAVIGDVKVYSFEAEIYITFIQNLQEYRKYLLSHYDDMQALYDSLEEEKSKETLAAFIKGRITGNQKYFTDVMVGDQYFPSDIIQLGEQEIIVEIGSYDGRTLLDIIDRTDGKFEKIYCFEPDRECVPLVENVIKKSGKAIQLVKKGVGEHIDKMYFRSDSTHGTSRVDKQQDYDYAIDITTLDDEVKGHVTYIKMDVEGMELSCLKGASTIISTYAPKLAVCVYHNKEDILEIPKFLRMLNPKYKFYLRHHSWGAAETVLYAI